jgi:hypothetical protein
MMPECAGPVRISVTELAPLLGLWPRALPRRQWDTHAVRRHANERSVLRRRKPKRPPDVPLYGLGKAWSGRRESSGAWNLDGQWISYSLRHFRGRYWDSTKPRLVIGHEFKAAAGTDEPRSLDAAAAQAVTTFLADNNPLRLGDEDRRAWIRAELQAVGQDEALGSDWDNHELYLDGSPHLSRIKRMPDGYCVVAETQDSYLAISARLLPTQLRLARQQDLRAIYKTDD